MQRELIAQWVLCFYIYCFAGWIWETCYVSVCERKFVNRGFMKGPLLPIYGSGALCVLLVSEPFRGNWVLMALVGMLAATILEYVTGAVMEALFRVRYWDYSTQFLNINGYVCLKSTLCWGVMTLAAVYVIHPPIAAFVESLGKIWVYRLDAIITLVSVADFSTSFKAARDFGSLLIWAEKLKEEMRGIQVGLEELTQDLKERVVEPFQEKTGRTMEAFQEKTGRTMEAFQEKTSRTVEAFQEKTGRTMEAFQEKTGRTVEAFQEKTGRTVEAFQEKTGRTVEVLQEELGKLYNRKDAMQEVLRSGYYRGVNGLLKRNPGTVWKRNPEILDEIKKMFRGDPEQNGDK